MTITVSELEKDDDSYITPIDMRVTEIAHEAARLDGKVPNRVRADIETMFKVYKFFVTEDLNDKEYNEIEEILKSAVSNISNSLGIQTSRGVSVERVKGRKSIRVGE